MSFEWNEQLVRTISETNLSLAILGEIIIAISLGAIYSIKLVVYGYYILITATLIIVGYLNHNYSNWLKEKR
jgi:hypothetical protein